MLTVDQIHALRPLNPSAHYKAKIITLRKPAILSGNMIVIITKGQLANSIRPPAKSV